MASRSVSSKGYQALHSAHLLKQATNLCQSQDHRQLLVRAGDSDIVQPGHLDVEHRPVEQRGSNLRLCRRRHAAIHREVAQKGAYLARAELRGMALAVEEDEPATQSTYACSVR